MGLDKEAQEFNEKQKRLQEYSQTEGRGLSRIEDELRQLRKTLDNHLGFLIDTLLKYIEDEERRRNDEYKRSSYGMYDPFKYRSQRGYSDSGDQWSQWAQDKYRRDQPQWPKETPPYNSEEDPDNKKD